MEEDEVVCILETDKVSVEVRAPHGGVVTSVDAQVGQSVTVGGTLMHVDSELESGDETSGEQSVNEASSVGEAAMTTAIQVPGMGDSISEGEISALNKGMIDRAIS